MLLWCLSRAVEPTTGILTLFRTENDVICVDDAAGSHRVDIVITAGSDEPRLAGLQ